MGRFKKIDTGIEGLYIIEPKYLKDDRGYFVELFNKKNYEEMGLKFEFAQEHQSKSKKGVLRGLHYLSKNSQAKLIRCIKGKIYDVAVDLRKNSKTYGKWYGLTLEEHDDKLFLIPKGFAHGFLALDEDNIVCYLCDEVYNPKYEGGIMWNEPKINIQWPIEKIGIQKIILSEKDKTWKPLEL